MFRASVVAGILGVVVYWSAVAVAETPQERRRRELLEEIGLQRKTPPARPSEPAAPDAGAPSPTKVDSETEGGEAGGPQGAASKTPARPAAPSFRRAIHPALMQACRACHAPGGPAAMTRLILSGDAAADHRAVLPFVDVRNAPASALLIKAAGQAHGGGAPWPRGSELAARVTAWIGAGARLDGSGARAAVVPEPATPAIQTKPVRSGRPAPGPVLPATPAAAAGVAGVALGNESTPPARQTAPAQPAASRDGRADAAVVVHGLLMEKCASCHRPGMPAAVTRFVLSGAVEADLALAASLIDREAVARSPLVTRAAGELHGGGVVLPAGSEGQQRLLAWATSLVVGPGPADATPAVSAPVSPAPADPVAPASAPGPETAPRLTIAATAATAAPRLMGGRGPGVPLPYGFQLNGRFDVNYERRAFSGDPTASSATNGLRSYHHFLFLSRQDPQERVGLSVEMLGLLFWEANLRFRPREAWQVVVAAGKIVVPFGADPLTHQSYGGLAGFDQRLLPSVWATEGAAAHVVVHRGALSVTDDAYVVRGYALRRADAVLSLRSDLSPDDDARLAVGNRAGAAWGPAAVWYSAMFNTLGYGRRLFMQAADVTLWRARAIPVLRYISLGAGLMRADVSGGGAGADYYHFGSYFQARVHPCDWLYFQYRQGVTTVDNRRGTIVDRTRLTSDDASAHNLGVVARRGGWTAGLFWFVNLEAVEIPNDLVRAVVTYEF